MAAINHVQSCAAPTRAQRVVHRAIIRTIYR